FEIERLAEIAGERRQQPIAVLHDERPVQPVGLAHKLDVLVARALTRDGDRRVARQAQQHKRDHRDECGDEDGESQPLHRVEQHQTLRMGDPACALSPNHMDAGLPERGITHGSVAPRTSADEARGTSDGALRTYLLPDRGLAYRRPKLVRAAHLAAAARAPAPVPTSTSFPKSAGSHPDTA